MAVTPRQVRPSPTSPRAACSPASATAAPASPAARPFLTPCAPAPGSSPPSPPSFGPVHNRATTPDGDIRRCRCRRLHGPQDALIGTPLNPGTYDDEGAVLVNAHASALWARFTTYLRREIAAELGVTQRGLRGPAGVLREGHRVRVRVTVESDAAGDRELGWGGQFDVREIASSDMGSPTHELSH
ncbi:MULTISPECIES: replication initiator [Streptomyces]|uniref:replication initiator n=1 Tax=Streptomyces TaxID=1883 RepID=UPI00368C0B50